MRITGGEFGGRTLKTLPGELVRPTLDRVRQALFNILGPRLSGAAVLDLFAGSGALGLEALSRGASRAVFVEKDRRAVAVIRENVETLGVVERASVRCMDALKSVASLAALGGPFDVVLIDPPYRVAMQVVGGSKFGEFLESLWSAGVVEPARGLVVLQHDRRAQVADAWRNFRVSDRRDYGETSLAFLVKK